MNSGKPESFQSGKLPGIILCGGQGTRLWPLTLEKQKAMIPVCGKPIIASVVDFWKRFCDRFIFVVKHRKEELIEYLKSLPIQASFVEPETLRGIADGLSFARPFIENRFIVVLSDCLCTGEFCFPEKMELGVGVRKTLNPREIRQSYSIEIDSARGFISHVEEKPANPPNDLCGLGYYFFDTRVFEYIKKTPPSKLRNEIEITDVIENMIRGGECVSPVRLAGEYLNVTFPEDIEKASRLFFPKNK